MILLLVQFQETVFALKRSLKLNEVSISRIAFREVHLVLFRICLLQLFALHLIYKPARWSCGRVSILRLKGSCVQIQAEAYQKRNPENILTLSIADTFTQLKLKKKY